MRKLLILFLLACQLCGHALVAAAARNFPEKAKRGELKSHQYPNMKIGDKTLRLAPGGRIYNQQNLIIVPVSLRPQSAPVMYATDVNGNLSAVWILTAEEAALHPLKGDPAPKSGSGR